MKILLVDDEELQLVRLENVCKKVLPNEEFFKYTNPKKAYEENIENKFDIAFLDIEMPVLTGIQLAKKLKKINPLINIIFVTAYNNYAITHIQSLAKNAVSSKNYSELEKVFGTFFSTKKF